jgi:hypothetical protein
VTLAGAGGFRWDSRCQIYSPSDGVITFYNTAAAGFGRFNGGGTTPAFPGLGRTNGDWIVTGGDGALSGQVTNRFLFPGGFAIGPAGATLTNLLFASATLDFPATTTGTISDLPITLAGAADGDVVNVGAPSGSCTAISGSFSGFASNGVVFVRFTSTGTAQNPASGLFKVSLQKFLP